MRAHEPLVFEPTVMKNTGDCGVACMRMLTGKSYEDVVAALPARTRKSIMESGLSNRQLTRLATRLGFKLRYRPSTIENDVVQIRGSVGILDLERPSDPKDESAPWEGHFAFYAHGVIYNPAENLAWTDLDAFLKTRRWRVLGLFVRITPGEDN